MNGWNYICYCVHYTIGYVLATEVIPDATDDKRLIEI